DAGLRSGRRRGRRERDVGLRADRQRPADRQHHQHRTTHSPRKADSLGHAWKPVPVTTNERAERKKHKSGWIFRPVLRSRCEVLVWNEDFFRQNWRRRGKIVRARRLTRTPPRTADPRAA